MSTQAPIVIVGCRRSGTALLRSRLNEHPQLKVHSIVRDPRANVLSQHSRWPNASLWECAVWWRDAVRLAREWQQKNLTLYTELRYENLALDPESTLRHLCNELGITYRPDLLDFELRSNFYKPNAPPQSVTFTRVDPSRIDHWQEQLTPMEIKLIESCVKSEMTTWGYEPLNPEVPPLIFVPNPLWRKKSYRLRQIGRSWRDWVQRKVK